MTNRIYVILTITIEITVIIWLGLLLLRELKLLIIIISFLIINVVRVATIVAVNDVIIIWIT